MAGFMRVLFVSLGNIGRRHLQNLRRLEPHVDVTVWRRRSRDSSVPGADRVVFDLESALQTRPDAALLVGPASDHVEVGLQLARQGVHLFVEKPLSNRLENTQELIQECKSRGRVLMVGYNFRFNRSLKAMRAALLEGKIGRLQALRAEVGQYLPEWRPGLDYRSSASAREDLGGGAVLELSHEIDYVRWLGGEVTAVTAKMGRVSDLDLDVEDTAEILLQLEGGELASVHMDMVQRLPIRTCRAVGSEGMLVWDGIAHQSRLWTVGQGGWSDLGPEEGACDRNEMYVEELRHFLACVRGETAPAVTGEEGRRVLAIALAAKQSSRESRTVEL